MSKKKRSKYVNYNKIVSDTHTSTPETVEEVEETKEAAFGAEELTGQINAALVNVRAWANPKASIVEQVRKGKTVKMYELVNGYWRTELGYIREDLVEVVEKP